MNPKCRHCCFTYEPHDFKAYAKHILDKHKDDKALVDYANSTLHPETRQEPGKEPSLMRRMFR